MTDQKLSSSLLEEVYRFEEVLNAVENESISTDEAIGLISGIQRDIVQLYRACA